MNGTRGSARETNRLGSLPLFLSLFLLLLAFFIFLNSISSFETGKSDRVLESIRSTFPGYGPGGEGTGLLDGDEAGLVEQSLAVRLDEAFAFAFPRLQPQIVNEADRIYVDVPLDRLFVDGGAEPRTTLDVLTRRVSAVLADPSSSQVLETQVLFGYSGGAGRLAANSVALNRADTVIQKMLAAGSPPRLTSVGFEPGHPGEIRFRIRAVRRRGVG